jgi:hypothetical protein
LVTAFGTLVGIFFILTGQTLDLARDKVLDERRVIAEMTARQVDGFLIDASTKLDGAARSLGREASLPDNPATQYAVAELRGRNTDLFLSVRVLDRQGRMILSDPPNTAPASGSPSEQPHISYVNQFGSKAISDSFVDADSGGIVVEIAVPVLAGHGGLVGILAGIVNLGSTNITGSLSQARDLGETGHADLIDTHGRVLASTEIGAPLRPGDHPEFYRRMALVRVPDVESVPHESEGHSENEAERHVMAFAPLLEVDWGVSVGGDEDETFTRVRRIRTQTYAIGGGAAAALLAASVLAARLLMPRR